MRGATSLTAAVTTFLAWRAILTPGALLAITSLLG